MILYHLRTDKNVAVILSVAVKKIYKNKNIKR